MKFISKNSNLRIILKPGIPAQPVLGIPAVSSVSVKFQDGLAEIKDERILEKMYTHSGFNTDFIAVDDNGNDPFVSQRTEIEPAHVLSEIKYGHVERSMGSAKKVALTPEMREIVNSMANEIANKRLQAILPSLIEETMNKMAKSIADKKSNQEQDGKIAAVEGDPSLLEEEEIPYVGTESENKEEAEEELEYKPVSLKPLSNSSKEPKKKK